MKEKEYVMCDFEILEGEREYTESYYYPKERYDKLDYTRNFKADEKQLKFLSSIGVWGEQE